MKLTQIAAWSLLLLHGLCGGAAAAQTVSRLPWFEQGRPSAQALQAVAILADAASDGLDPLDYRVQELQAAIDRAGAATAPDSGAQVRLETALTRSMQRYLSDLHSGRIDPLQIHARFELPRNRSFEPDAALGAALAAHRLPLAAREAAPQLSQYAQLRGLLRQYQALGAHPAWAQPLAPPARSKLEPGQSYPDLGRLAQRLQALGDLGPGAGLPVSYDDTLAAAIRSFQQRHGLAEDGVIGRSTLAALNVAPAQRAQQIALALERLRWTPLLEGPRMIVVNVPEFVLRAYETRGEQVDVKLEMKVVVGRALNTRTPLLGADLRAIEFSPYWNVPRSIARAETVPRIRRDPAYFRQQGFEFVGQDGKASTTLGAAQLDAVLRGELRIRQRPGPNNALGDIKFVFPNSDDIYLHHTPALQLFERDRRDFSHGCIRVQEPVELAKFVLRNQAEWTETRIRAAMDHGVSQTLRLDQPLPVLIVYVTALVKQGRGYFYTDLYGQDRLLEQVLRQRNARMPPS